MCGSFGKIIKRPINSYSVTKCTKYENCCFFECYELGLVLLFNNLICFHFFKELIFSTSWKIDFFRRRSGINFINPDFFVCMMDWRYKTYIRSCKNVISLNWPPNECTITTCIKLIKVIERNILTGTFWTFISRNLSIKLLLRLTG